MVAYRLVDLVGRASAANILGITVRELDKLVDVFELSEKFTALHDPSAAITWARKLMGVSKKLITPSVIDAVVKKVNQKRITNSKELRKLRAIVPDPVVRVHISSPTRATLILPCCDWGLLKRNPRVAFQVISMPRWKR